MADDITDGVENATEAPLQTEERSEELAGDEDIRDQLLDAYKDIEKGFSDQWERSNDQMDYWDCYHCTLGPKQFYSGNSKIFVPLVHDAVNARKTRFTNQVFPQSGKHVDVIASEDKPLGLMSLLEFYIRKAKLRSRVMPSLVKNGDMEGQFNVYLKWIRNERHVAMRVPQNRHPRLFPGIGGGMDEPIENAEFEDDIDDIEELVDVHQYPGVEVLADCDVLILPLTGIDSVEDAIDKGGSATIIRRWTKAKVKQMVRDGEIEEEAGESLIESMEGKSSADTPNKTKIVTDAAGIKSDGSKSYALVYETWKKLIVKNDKGDKELRICRSYLGGADRVVGCKLNPYWCDKVPLLSSPVERVQGSFKGVSKVKFVESMQYAANDAINEGMDAAAYALMPIVITDPERNPRTGSMVLNVAAVWECDPKSTQFAKFPALWQDAFTIVNAAKDQILQTLGINPAMMPQQTMAPGKKPNQAMIANEQQVDILTTADSVTIIEEEILSPMLQWFVWMDHQFRDKDTLVPNFGKIGLKMEMERVPPIQMGKRFEFRWYGVEAARSLQQMQMQMAGLNVIKGIPPQMYPGYKIQLAPLMQHWVDNIFGPRLGGEIFTDQKAELTIDANFENRMMRQGLMAAVHPLDNDAEHLKAHFQAMQEYGDDQYGVFREHMQRHQQQMQMKQKMAQMQAMGMLPGQQQDQQQGKRRGEGGGQPREGAASALPRPQGPPGQIHQDRMPMGMPRAARQ